MRQLVAALGYVHLKGFVHRDVKPGNLLLFAGGVLKLADFGISQRADDKLAFCACTVAFAAPEVLSPSRGQLSAKVTDHLMGQGN